ncbi:MAG: hypothetical protein QW348_00280 [Ignisphaera sp.]
MDAVIVERNGFVIAIKSLDGGVREEDIPLVIKAVETFLNQPLGHATSSFPGNGHNNGKKLNGNGDTRKGVLYSPWLLTWLAEANGYRDHFHAVLSVFANSKKQ